MKVILICPSERHEMEELTGNRPLVALPLLGDTALGLWLSHLAARGVKQVKILAADRADYIKTLVGSGEKWGLEATVHSDGIVAIPEDVQIVDHLPWDDSYPMFGGYASWFGACQAILNQIQPGFRLG